MQLVIEISDGLYNNLGTIKNGSIASKIILDCARKGQALPKEHGRLIDADAIVYEKECVYLSDGGCTTESTPNIAKTPTIIEADKEERK